MNSKVCIVDVKIETYIFHNTPSPNPLVCLISGYWKAQGSVVTLNSKPMDGWLNYIVADDPNGDLVVDEALLQYPNTYKVGRSFPDCSYDKEWESAEPDLTIYESFVKGWLRKYPSYNPLRLTSFTLTPLFIGDKTSLEEGEYFVLDRVLTLEQVLLLIEAGATNCILGYEQIVNDVKRFEEMIQLFKLTKVLRRKDAKFTFEWSAELVQNLDRYIEIWKTYKPGRMCVLRLTAHGDSLTTDDKIALYNWIGDWRMLAGKSIKFYPVNYSQNYREFTEFKRWTNSRAGYSKNSLVDYILYDSCRDLDRLARFLIEPHSYTTQGKHGTNKLGWLVDFFETADSRLIETYCTSYPRGGS